MDTALPYLVLAEATFVVHRSLRWREVQVQVELTETVVFAGIKDRTMDRVLGRLLLTWVGQRVTGLY